MRDPAVIKTMDVLNERGAVNALFVGGCVRNTVMGCVVGDIDIASVLRPESVIERFETAGLRAIPTGIAHGTITVVVEGQTFEITTLRSDIATDGRHADVAFTNNWHTDASRRDFTMNALYADLNGTVYDLLGSGWQDCNNRLVRFIGNAKDRIDEDVLRILRFFRFHAQYGSGAPDDSALRACAEKASLLPDLSRERISQEFFKILDTDAVFETVLLMYDTGVLKHIVANTFDFNVFERVSNLGDAYLTLFALAEYNFKTLQSFENRLCIPKNSMAHLKTVDLLIKDDFYKSDKALKTTVYYNGKSVVCDALTAHYSYSHINKEHYKNLIERIEKWDIPVFPITGHNLIAEGYSQGAELGTELKRRERDWLERVI